MSADRITIRFTTDQARAITKKSQEVGLTESELIRLAVASFLAREDALTEYLEAVESLDKRLVVLMKRQELFARAIGAISAAPDSVKNQALAQQFSEKVTSIIDAVN